MYACIHKYMNIYCIAHPIWICATLAGPSINSSDPPPTPNPEPNPDPNPEPSTASPPSSPPPSPPSATGASS